MELEDMGVIIFLISLVVVSYFGIILVMSGHYSHEFCESKGYDSASVINANILECKRVSITADNRLKEETKYYPKDEMKEQHPIFYKINIAE